MNTFLLLVIVICLSQQAQVTPQSVATETQQESNALATFGLTHGPFIGHVTPTTARIWGRCESSGLHLCTLEDKTTGGRVIARATAIEENDFCVLWNFKDLAPSRMYRYEVTQGGKILNPGPGYQFKTAPKQDGRSTVKIAFGSCAREDAGTASVWTRLAELELDAFVLLGDTPYIDTTKLAVQRRRYREFAAVPAMKKLFRSTSMYGTWDDHDFGRNDTDGRLAGKHLSRQAFIEYRANPSYGNRDHGIYTSFRRGAVEVFLLDTRYFAGTEKSLSDESRLTLLGTDQWQWLKKSLKVSTAPFKVLACGMIWNGAVRPLKPDHWMSYQHERKALFRFLGEQKISGVVLVGGDIHRSRVLRHKTRDIVGYDLIELITSPMHAGIIKLANAPHPGLIFDAGEPNSFLLLTADTKKNELVCQLQNAAGNVLHEERIKNVESSSR